jgi:heterodisulfide reductase subunit A-like polyferredoxin
VSELESERWIGESGLTATNVIGPQHSTLALLLALVVCAGVRDAAHQPTFQTPHSLTRPKLLSRRLHNRFRGTSAVPSECERRAQAPTISRHTPA